jgi:hypothetical protein
MVRQRPTADHFKDEVPLAPETLRVAQSSKLDRWPSKMDRKDWFRIGLGGIAAATLTIPSTGALAVGWTGNDIQSKCAVSSAFVNGTCMGYILGLFDAFEVQQLICPGEIANGQKVDVVFEYLRENPATRHQIAPTLILAAGKAAFPCK